MSVYRRGWWRISNPEQIKELLSCLNLRGIRERNLQKTLEKHLDFVCVSNTKTKKNSKNNHFCFYLSSVSLYFVLSQGFSVFLFVTFSYTDSGEHGDNI